MEDQKRTINVDNKGIEMSSVSKELLSQIKAKIMPRQTEAKNYSDSIIKEASVFNADGEKAFGDESAYFEFKKLLAKRQQQKQTESMEASM